MIVARAELDPNLVAPALSLLLLSGLLLFGLFLSASFVLVRTMRRIRRDLVRRPCAPTPVDDVWLMHQLPEERDDRLT